MKFLNFLRSLFFKKKKQDPIIPDAPVYREEPIVEIPECVAEQIAGEAIVVTPNKKKSYKKKKYNGNIT
jgi:hypothetical protein